LPNANHAIPDGVPHCARCLLDVLPGPHDEIPHGCADVLDVSPRRLPVTADDGQHEADHVTNDADGRLDNDADLSPDTLQESEDRGAPVLPEGRQPTPDRLDRLPDVLGHLNGRDLQALPNREGNGLDVVPEPLQNGLDLVPV